MNRQPKGQLRVIVDCQLLQTSDRKRGMGFYLKSLLGGVSQVKHAGIDWLFVLNARLPDITGEDKMLLEALGGAFISVDLLHQGDCRLFDQAATQNRRALDTALSADLSRDDGTKVIYFIPALFSREIYPVFPTAGTANMLLFHDLIPFLYHKQYFQDYEGEARKDYAQRFREFYRTDTFVTNSQTTADDLTVYFGIDPSRIVPTLGAAADRSAFKPEPPAIAPELNAGYVFMPSGDDLRKNNFVAAQAFAGLQSNLKLVLTSNFSEGSQRTLRELCPDIVFAGSVSDAEFLWLVDNAQAIFFPALYEGLGMPVLEAVERGVKVACSNTPVFVEISPDAFYYFDPVSASDMTAVLRRALAARDTDKDWQAKRRLYPAILEAFSWRRSAELFLGAMQQCEPAPPRQKLAVFCPSPSSYSSVGKYAFEVHGELSRLYDVDYYIEVGQTPFQPTRPNILEYAANYQPASTFTPDVASRYDYVLYHIGNSEFHVSTILNSLRLPAAAIVHDTRLNGIFDYMHHQGFMPAERRRFETLLDERLGCKLSSCLASIATNQEVLFCHSHYAHDAIREVVTSPRPMIRDVKHPIGVPGIELARGEAPTVSFAGIISEDKGIHLVADVSKLERVRVKVFGFGVLGDSPLLQGLDNVTITHDLTDKEFQDEVRSSDILVNYRPNYHGETSRSTLEAMRYGAVVIVKNVGWYGELPDDVVVKVENEADVLAVIKQLVAQPAKRKAIGSAARKFLAQHYNYRDYARAFADGLQKGVK